MTQQPQKPRRTALRPNSRLRDNEALQSIFDQPEPVAPQPDTPERVVIVQQVAGNQGGGLLNLIILPLRKAFAAIFWFVRVILEAMLRSVISFIIGLILMILITGFVGIYSVALIDSDMQMGKALSLSVERIVYFVQHPDSLQQTLDNMRNETSTSVPESR